ncbi:MAG: hypothetical protein ACJ8E4_08285 [Sphingomicrobium sp.]
MAHKALVALFSMIVAAAPASASNDDPAVMGAPAGNADTRYCMRVDPFTGSHIETIKCWTREQWAEQGVDVDKEWAKDGVAVRG